MIECISIALWKLRITTEQVRKREKWETFQGRINSLWIQKWMLSCHGWFLTIKYRFFFYFVLLLYFVLFCYSHLLLNICQLCQYCIWHNSCTNIFKWLVGLFYMVFHNEKPWHDMNRDLIFNSFDFSTRFKQKTYTHAEEVWWNAEIF